MIHKRPEVPGILIDYGKHRLRVGWRREHSHRIWQSIQSLLFFVAWHELAHYTNSYQDDALRMLIKDYGWPNWEP